MAKEKSSSGNGYWFGDDSIHTIKMVVIAVGTIVLLAFILMILNNKKYMRQSKTGDKP